MKPDFNLCLEAARRIVAAYRAEAPEGCDPQCTWAAVAIGVGSLVAGGVSAYSSSSAGKSAEGAASNAANQYKKVAKKGMGMLDTARDEQLALLEPFAGKFDLEKILQSVIGTNTKLYPQAQAYARMVNQGNQNQLDKFLGRALPGVRGMVEQASNNTLSMLRGEIPADVEASRRRRAAQQSLQGGFGNSESSRALEARDLGLESLQLMQEGSNSAQRWIQTARQHLMAPLYDPTSLLGTPQMQLQSILGGLDVARLQAGIIGDTTGKQVSLLTGQQNAATGAYMGGAEARIKADVTAGGNIASGINGAANAAGGYFATQPTNNQFSTQPWAAGDWRKSAGGRV